jgi:hypothetical protein
VCGTNERIHCEEGRDSSSFLEDLEITEPPVPVFLKNFRIREPPVPIFHKPSNNWFSLNRRI